MRKVMEVPRSGSAHHPAVLRRRQQIRRLVHGNQMLVLIQNVYLRAPCFTHSFQITMHT